MFFDLKNLLTKGYNCNYSLLILNQTSNVNNVFLCFLNTYKEPIHMTDSIKKISNDLKKFAIERDWEQFHTPKNLSMALIAEAAELVEHFQWLTPEQSKMIKGEKLADISHEIADIFIYLLRITEQLDVDLVKATREKMTINETRFPIDEKGKQNSKDRKYKYRE